MKDGKRWEIPADMYPAIEQGAILLKDARNKAAAWAFLQFVKGADARTTLEKFGFTIPEVNMPAAGKP
jgi:molybdate transport system substrate-binding protein